MCIRDRDKKKGEILQEKFGIEGGENLSTKSVLKGLLSNKLDKKINKDQPAQERELKERDSAEAETGADAKSEPEAEDTRSDKDKLKDDLKNKLLDGLFGK